MQLRTLSRLVSKHGSLGASFEYHRQLSTAPYLRLTNEIENDPLPWHWFKAAYAKLLKLTLVLKNVEKVNGRFVYCNVNLIITDKNVIEYAEVFNSIAKEFIGSPWMQHDLLKKCTVPCFHRQSERNFMKLNSLTKLCNILNISAQQRSNIRLTICPQVTQHHIWHGALEQVLCDLQKDMEALQCSSHGFQMGKQIVFTCIRFLREAANISESSTPSWMRPGSRTKSQNLPSRLKWQEVLYMLTDLSKCLSQEQTLECHHAKIEAMREGLYQIRDILIERDIGYKEARQLDCLVKKKLTKSLGHSSKCLFTLLVYYLYGSVHDIDIDLCGGLHKKFDDQNKMCLSVGKIWSSCDEKMVMSGIKQLNAALGLFKFAWETAEANGDLELQGHLWCVGIQEKVIKYRSNIFFLHEIKLLK